MNVKKVSFLLIIGGVCTMLLALNMDTSVLTGMGRVHNIGLLSRQSNLLILGGLLFLSGIVLFSLFKIKQTPEDEAKRKAELQAKRKEILEWVKRALSVMTGIFGSVFNEAKRKEILDWVKRATGAISGIFVSVFEEAKQKENPEWVKRDKNFEKRVAPSIGPVNKPVLYIFGVLWVSALVVITIMYQERNEAPTQEANAKLSSVPVKSISEPPREPELRAEWDCRSQVEIHDSTKTLIFQAERTAGIVESIKGTPPFEVRVGVSSCVQLSRLYYAPAPYTFIIDLVPFTKDGVANLTVE